MKALLACGAIGLFAGPALAAPHPPASEPERALNATLRVADKDEKEFDNLSLAPRKPTFRPTVDYRRMLSAPLLAAFVSQQRRVLKADCGGKYLEGELCGMDYDPITCAQDSPDHYLFETLRADPTSAVVKMSWPHENQITTYRLVRRQGRWLIDGIHCADADAGFNMP
jgi:hypothetical protein